MRKPIALKNCAEIGYVKKTHGVQGGLHLILDVTFRKTIDQFEFIYFEIDGLLVPFFIKTINGIGNGFANIEFKHIASKEKAQQFAGTKLFLDKDKVTDDSTTFSPSSLKGFTIIDKTLGELGEVTEVNDYEGNIVLSLTYKNNEVMIPFNEDLILSFDRDNSIVKMDCPEGLFDLTE